MQIPKNEIETLFSLLKLQLQTQKIYSIPSKPFHFNKIQVQTFGVEKL